MISAEDAFEQPEVVQSWIIPSEAVTVHRNSPLGTGRAQSVFLGTWNGGLVAVKMLSKDVSSEVTTSINRATMGDLIIVR
jgi:hypothetical protein